MALVGLASCGATKWSLVWHSWQRPRLVGLACAALTDGGLCGTNSSWPERRVGLSGATKWSLVWHSLGRGRDALGWPERRYRVEALCKALIYASLVRRYVEEAVRH